MGKHVIYTNGVIAYREKFLLKDKLLKLCEGTAEDAFKSLNESGYGNGAEAASLYDYELLTAAEESALDDFIREYAPSRAEKAYLLAPRDFHNAKAILKAEYLGADAEKMLAPDGEIPISDLSVSLRSGDFSSLGKELGKTAKEAAELLKEEGASGAEIGGVFEREPREVVERGAPRVVRPKGEETARHLVAQPLADQTDDAVHVEVRRAVGLEGEELRLKLIVAAGGPDQIDGAALVGAVAVGFHISR